MQVKQTLAEIAKLKDKLQTLLPYDKSHLQRMRQKFRFDWNFHANSLIGNSLSFQEVKSLLLFGVTAFNKPLEDHIAILSHNYLIKSAEKLAEQGIPLNEKLILEFHKLLFTENKRIDSIQFDDKDEADLFFWKAGQYKSIPNKMLTNTGEFIFFSAPEKTPQEMKFLMNWLIQELEKSEMDPVLVAIELHYKFLKIHPFDDGNGRLALILMNFILIQFGYAPVVISMEDKENYHKAFQQEDAGIENALLDFLSLKILVGLQNKYKILQGESLLEQNAIDQEITSFKMILNGNLNEPETKISAANIQKLTVDVFTPLVALFLKKMSQFDDLYLEKKIDLQIILGEANKTITIENAKNFESQVLEAIEEGVGNINLTYKLLVFKHLKGQLKNHSSVLNFKLEKFQYQIELPEINFSITKKYDEALSDEEVLDLINRHVKNKLIKIKQTLKT